MPAEGPLVPAGGGGEFSTVNFVLQFGGWRLPPPPSRANPQKLTFVENVIRRSPCAASAAGRTATSMIPLNPEYTGWFNRLLMFTDRFSR